jgi:hypothetical protein
LQHLGIQARLRERAVDGDLQRLAFERGEHAVLLLEPALLQWNTRDQIDLLRFNFH